MKSPIKDKPLRNPGQSLDEQIWDSVYDEIFKYFFISFILIMMAGMEWLHWYFKSPPSPLLYSFIALIAVLYSAVKIIRAMKRIKTLKQGRDGEKAVGQYLELLRENGAKVFHDIPAKGFNLDHVVICKSGVYVIDSSVISSHQFNLTIWRESINYSLIKT